VKTVLDTDDLESIPRLLRRRAPLGYIALWHLIKLVSEVRRNGPLGSQPFSERIPLLPATA
jgi:hypothetical protein